MEKILVSACLLGDPVRYNGAHKRCDDDILRRWIAEGRVVPVCPEIAGGLPVPRLPAEIVDRDAGTVIDSKGNDVSVHFADGASHALALARANAIRIAILKEGSPSCGSSFSYDGTFSGTRVAQPGLTAALLRAHGVHVFSEAQLDDAERLLQGSERA